MKVRLTVAELDAHIEMQRAYLRRAMREHRGELAVATARHLDALHLERKLVHALERDPVRVAPSVPMQGERAS